MFKKSLFYDIIQGMKNKIAIFSSLLCLYGANVWASECIGAGCDFEPVWDMPVLEPAVINDVIPANAVQEAEYNQSMAYMMPMHQVKLLSIKPVESDNRPALWDGTDQPYESQGFDKTVSRYDGAPLWDDSVIDYKKKDFSDWYLAPTPELYIRDSQPNDDIVAMYEQNMRDAADTRARVEELLAPKRPESNLWADFNSESDCGTSQPVQENNFEAISITESSFVLDDGCPFETETECNIWRRKPMIRETVSPRSPKIRNDLMADFIQAAKCNDEITASDAVAAPLLARYKMLMNSANACCTDGLAYSLKEAGATDGLVYKFMTDDANFYGFGARCLMMTDTELDEKYPNTATAAVTADVRNGCLCRGRQWFKSMLAPFEDAYKAYPDFAQQKFYYTYTDGLQREITVSVNNDVQNVLNQLERCP